MGYLDTKQMLHKCATGVLLVMVISLAGWNLQLRSKNTMDTMGGVQSEDVKKVRKRALNDDPHPHVLTAHSMGGAVYIRWGRSVCPHADDTNELVYEGIVASDHNGHTGGSSEYLCLPREPQWGKFINGGQPWATLYGAEFFGTDNLFEKDNFGGSILNQDAKCAVCRSMDRPSQLMIPGRRDCYEGWTREYEGYLMSSHYSDKSGRNYICMDRAPEADPEGYRADGGGRLYPVESRCGSMPCPNYVDGRELTCVVCTK